MAQGLRQYLELGMQIREMSRSQAQRLARQLVREGQLAESRARHFVEELVERNRRRSEQLRTLVQREIKRQLAAAGVATKEDLARLERKLTAGSRRVAPAKGPATRAKAPAGKTKGPAAKPATGTRRAGS